PLSQIRRLAVFTKIIFTETSNRLISTENGGKPASIPSVHDTTRSLPSTTNLPLHKQSTSASMISPAARMTSASALPLTSTSRCWPSSGSKSRSHTARGERWSYLFAGGVEDDCNLHAFFKGLVHYGQLNRQRRALFNRLRDTFPPLVRPALESDTTATAGAKRRATEAFGDVAGDGVACLVFRDGRSVIKNERKRREEGYIGVYVLRIRFTQGIFVHIPSPPPVSVPLLTPQPHKSGTRLRMGHLCHARGPRGPERAHATVGDKAVDRSGQEGRLEHAAGTISTARRGPRPAVRRRGTGQGRI
ncbi:hypothetical protein BC938DRAFT_483681, partial [Jimgerdemannia flammicorona]